jgi:hypothetical protein
MNEPSREELDAAAEALQDLGLGVTPPTVKTPDDEVVQVIVRAPVTSRERWKAAADHLGLSMSEYIRQLADNRAEEILECAHRHVKHYPWANICTACGKRVWVNSRYAGTR